MAKIFIKIICVVFFIYMALGAYLYVNQRNMLYFPQVYTQKKYPALNIQQPNANISVIQLSDNVYQKSEASQESEENQNSKAKPAIIYFGGNAEAVINSAAMFQPLQQAYTIYLVNYRGYGESTGQMTETTNYADALAVYKAVATLHTDISVVGRSLGTGMASYVAAHRHIDKLVLITPFDSILQVAQRKFPIYPLKLLLKDTYASVVRVHNITADTLILSAENDQVIPVAHAKNLANAFRKEPLYYQIDNANHNSIMMKKNAQTYLYQFFNVYPK